MKKYFNIHTLNGSVFIILVASITTYLLSLVPFLEPVNDSVTEWDFTDIYYKTNPKFKDHRLDTNIFIVNLGHLDRAGIAKLLDDVNSYSPKVVGVAARFLNEKDDRIDSLLETALAKTKNLVMVGRLTEDTIFVEQDGYFIEPSHQRFAKHGATGMTNLFPGKKDVVRNYPVYEDDISNGRTYAFSIELLRKYKPNIVKPLLEQEDWEGIIKYQGHMNYYYHIDYDDDNKLQVYNLEQNPVGWDWVKANQDLSILKDKIVLVGFVGRNKNTLSEYIEDLYNSPLKSQFWSFDTPDIYGIAVLANITSMYLNNDGVVSYEGEELFSSWLILAGFLIIIQILHLKVNIDNQMIDRAMALFVIFILIFSSVKFFSSGIYINLTLAVFWLLFATDANELYLKIYQPIALQLSSIGKKIFVYTPLVAILLLILGSVLSQMGLPLLKMSYVALDIMLLYFIGFFIYGIVIKSKNKRPDTAPK